MPWIEEEDCSGCGVCVETCPVGAIYMTDEKAVINMDDCIHCGLCHDACPEDAVKHDSDKIPDEVAANVALTREFMDACAKYLGNEEEKLKCLTRMIRHFKKEEAVAEKTLEELQRLKEQWR